MNEDVRPGLVRVVDWERTSALMMGAAVVLSEGLLLILIGTAYPLETLLVGTVAFALVFLALLPLVFRLPARLRRKYEQAAQFDGLNESRVVQAAARRISLRRAAAIAGVSACWMMLLGLVGHDPMPPFVLIAVALPQWARSRTTAEWERVNRAVLWQGVPGILGARGPVFRVPAEGGR
ncbi:hypothetical protein ACIP98_01235 [Streptomyces sp. NPDC088354]|uniref:hypothetical protein n=1 Tax=Streptomyces sp. NPDC088354 TaxID=3365856 RepID=UPI0038083E9B